MRYSAEAELAHFRPIGYPHPDNPRGEWITLADSLARSLGDDVIPACPRLQRHCPELRRELVEPFQRPCHSLLTG
jgi:hypothetical protein